MPTHQDRAQKFMADLLAGRSLGELDERLAPRARDLKTIPRDPVIAPEPVNARWQALSLPDAARAELLDPHTLSQMAAYQKNIENFIGTIKLPVGIAGPLAVNGTYANGVYYVPLATTEAALVASYSRGAHLLSAAGGCTAMLLAEAVTRSPGYRFAELREAGRFAAWIMNQTDVLRTVAESTSRYCRLLDLRVHIEGNHVYLLFDYATGDAAGQNMVTIATDAAHQHILQHSPVRPQHAFVEANLSGDKKACAVSFTSVRGKKVTAEARIPAALLQKVLHTTAHDIEAYWRISALGGVQSGSIGIQGHFANGLAALYLACGQDAACVAESAVGVTRMEALDNGDLYAAVTLPNLIVGTVGGGTKLPSQSAALQLLALPEQGSARALAEVSAALCLGGELSIIAALTAGHFTHAHQSLARGTGA